MKKNEILNLDGRELTRRLIKSLTEKKITLEEYTAITDFWRFNKDKRTTLFDDKSEMPI